MSFIDADFSQPVAVDMNSLRVNGFGMVQFDRGDDGQVVNFRWERVRNAVESKRHGRPYFERKIFVTIHPPGERLNIIDREVMDSDKHRWPRQWNAFCANKVQVPDGTPVSQLFPANPEISGNLEGWGIYTVEQLANLSGTAIDQVGMGCQEWVNRAKKYLERATRGVDHHQLEELDRRHQSEIRTLHNTIADLNNRIGKLMDIINDQPGHVRRVVHDAGVHDPFPYSAPADGSPPRRPGTERAASVDPEPVDFVSAQQGTAEWVDPPAGFFSEPANQEPARQADLQREMIDGTHPSREAMPPSLPRHSARTATRPTSALAGSTTAHVPPTSVPGRSAKRSARRR